MPGLQPMVCNMRLPMLLSGMGGAFSPTTPEKTEVTDKQEGVFTVFMSVNIIAFHPKATQLTADLYSLGTHLTMDKII